MPANGPIHQRAAEPELREETIARVAPAPVGDVDPSSRRNLGRRGLRLGHGVALGIGALALALTLALGGGLPLALALGGGVAIGAGVIAALLLAEQEDGRIERIVERSEPGRDR